jgi:hypothetical protein
MDSSRDRSERDIQLAMASLQLPHMTNTTGVTSTRRRKNTNKYASIPPQAGFQTTPMKDRRSKLEEISPVPTVTILVCADIDLKSTSALAEYTLQQQQLYMQQKQRNRNPKQHHYHFDGSFPSKKKAGFDATAIDLIIAAGPCSRDEDLISYYRGKQKKKNARSSDSYFPGHTSDKLSDNLAPFLRSAEKTAALEGLMTAALSQLENIVCRVVYCPGFNDPVSTMVPTTLTGMYNELSYKRLTPNSRNIHQQWMPLAPGLGCAALFYFDTSSSKLLHHPGEKPHASTVDDSQHDTSYHRHEDITDNDDDDEDDDDVRRKNETELVVEQITRMQLQ